MKLILNSQEPHKKNNFRLLTSFILITCGFSEEADLHLSAVTSSPYLLCPPPPRAAFPEGGARDGWLLLSRQSSFIAVHPRAGHTSLHITVHPYQRSSSGDTAARARIFAKRDFLALISSDFFFKNWSRLVCCSGTGSATPGHSAGIRARLQLIITRDTGHYSCTRGRYFGLL